jgi:hypothetical protein
MKRITIHRALSELKTLNERIGKAIAGFEPVGVYQKGRPVQTTSMFNTDEVKHKTAAEAAYQSITTLIANKSNLKKAIVASNSQTIVTIGAKTMTVAEAITRKSYLQLSKDLLNRMEAQMRAVQANLNKFNEKVQVGKEQLLVASFGKDTKPDDSQIENVTRPYLEMNTFHLADPLGLTKKIEELSTEIRTFESEVDAVLSESNAITFIEVEEF